MSFKENFLRGLSHIKCFIELEIKSQLQFEQLNQTITNMAYILKTEKNWQTINILCKTSKTISDKYTTEK